MHTSDLGWDALIEAFGPDFSIVDNRAYFLSRFMDLSRGAFNKLTHEDAGVLRGVRACRVR